MHRIFCKTDVCSFIGLLLLLALISPVRLIAQESQPATDSASDNQVSVEEDPDHREGTLVPISLPITAAAATKIRSVLEQTLTRFTSTNDSEHYPVVVLEFDTRNSKTGQGSDFHGCLAIAELLTDIRMNRIHTVAYIPAPSGLAPGVEQLNVNPVSQLKGHAVLVALACNELAMHDHSSIGEAGIDDETPSRIRQVAYEDIATKRRVLPAPVALKMIDKRESLIRVVKTDESVVYVNPEQFASIKADSELLSFKEIVNDGSLALLTSDQLAEFRLIKHRVESRDELARRLNVDVQSLEFDPLQGQQRKAVQLNVNGFVDDRSVTWLIRALNQQSSSVNVVIVNIDANDGDPFECLRLAEFLASLDSTKVLTVAYIPRKAGGACSLIALACDRLIMGQEAVLGGPLETPLEKESLTDLSRAVKKLARETGFSRSALMAFVDPSIRLIQAHHSTSGDVVLMSEEERQSRADADEWNSKGSFDVSGGLNGEEAFQFQLADVLVSDFEQIKSLYQIESDPAVLQPTATDRWISSLAQTLASPWVAGWLLFGAMFLLSTELSQPGIGIPGFLGTLCLLLFFWSQYFDGNAHWLEILLFVAGAVFIGLEIFLLPGFGIFGFGGLIMVIASIVLATQTFVIPQNSEQFNQLPVSLSMVLAASGGFFVALALFRKFLPKTPYFKKMMLDPDDDNGLNERNERESMVNWQHLVGQTGLAVTRLAPAGKARIGHDIVDVITEGRMVEKDEAIKVIDVSGNRVVVERDPTV